MNTQQQILTQLLAKLEKDKASPVLIDSVRQALEEELKQKEM